MLAFLAVVAEEEEVAVVDLNGTAEEAIDMEVVVPVLMIGI